MLSKDFLWTNRSTGLSNVVDQRELLKILSISPLLISHTVQEIYSYLQFTLLQTWLIEMQMIIHDIYMLLTAQSIVLLEYNFNAYYSSLIYLSLKK